MLVTLPNVLDASQLARCRRQLEQAEWEDGARTAGYIAQQAKQNRQLPLDSSVAQQLGELILAALANNPGFVAAALPAKILPPRFNRYENAGHYGNHIDNAVFAAPGTPERVRSDVSCTLFLSEPGEYDGGELCIEDSYGAKRIKLPAGHMVVYPGTSLHHVTPVTRGKRLASFFWVQSMVRHAHQRALLWELDQSIQALAAQAGAPDTHIMAQVTRLSGVYHNLVREWAEI
jgi:PKHD-type hydroxylase